MAIVDGYDADSVTVSSTQNLGSGDYPHWVYVQISSGPYRRGTYKIFYNPGDEVSSESAAQSAGNGFYIHA